MHPSEFNGIYLKDLLENLSHENKTIVIMEDFNIGLLKYDTEKVSADFLDDMYASFLLPYISPPSRVTSRTKILIDNIFSSNIKDGCISGNIVTIIQQTVKYIIKTSKNSIKIRDLVNTNWDTILEVNNGDGDKSFETLITTVNSVIAEHAPLKKYLL